MLPNVDFSVETSGLNYLISLYIFKSVIFCGQSLSSDPLVKVVAANYFPQKTEMVLKNKIPVNKLFQ